MTQHQTSRTKSFSCINHARRPAWCGSILRLWNVRLSSSHLNGQVSISRSRSVTDEQSPTLLRRHTMDSFPISAKSETQRDSGSLGGSNANAVSDRAATSGPPPPIAICGMACRLPGGVMKPQDLWELILAKGDGRGRVPGSRYNVDAFYSSAGKPSTVATEYGYFLDEKVDLGALDTSVFPMSRFDVESTDPQERLMLEIAKECIEDAGVTGWSGRPIGCYIGNFGEDWQEISNRDTQRWGTYKTADFLISNRISYEMNWKGPSMTIRTACSASLVGLNEACMAISSGLCEGALVGGTNLIMSPSLTSSLSSQDVLSKEGSCKTFSAEADGYARGEALSAIFIKSLDSALRDGNPIRAVIRATAVNHDGRTNGIYQPSSEAQEELIRRAYRIAGLSDFCETAMVECHGTGTPVGDQIETKAIARVFGDSGGVYIGSVKPNVGHSEGASGLTSLIKMVLALENRTIPPNIKFNKPNPNIPFQEAHLTVPTEPTPWPESRVERVSINSFGIGGTNAHVILESASRYVKQVAAPPVSSPQLLLFSATTAKSLAKSRDQYTKWATSNPSRVGDLSYTLAHRREHLPWRTLAVAQNGVVANSSQTAKTVTNQHVVMAFTGQGAQWPGMGKELIQHNESFRCSIRSLDQHLRDVVVGATLAYSIEAELLKPTKDSSLHLASISQPVCTAVQLALVDALKAAGVTPSVVVGHSSGEIAAAYAAGALSASEAITVAHYRGVVADAQKKEGSMAAIGMGYQEVKKYLVPGSGVACHNSPNSATISGDTSSVQEVVRLVREARGDVLVKLLPVNKAYHSSHMVEVGKEYHQLLVKSKIVHRRPHLPFYSSVTGKLFAKGEGHLGPSYWQANLERPVLFEEAVSAIVNDMTGKNVVFLEVGPHSALAGPIREILQAAGAPTTYPYISAMTRRHDTMASFLSAVGSLFTFGVPVDLGSLIPSGKCLPDLPRYPWDHEESYWFESRVSKEWRQRKHRHHSLLGARVTESTDVEPSWRNLLHLQSVPWMRDHRLGDDLVFPLTGYLSMAAEAIRQLHGTLEGYRIRHLTVDIALVLFDGAPTELITTLRPYRLTNSLDSKWWEFTIASFNGHVWTVHCRGQITAVLLPDIKKAEKPLGPLPRRVDTRVWYRSMHRVGVNLGASFQTMSAIETSTTGSHSANADVVNERQEDSTDYYMHPTALDVIFQLQSASAVNGRPRLLRNWIPVSFEEIRVLRCEAPMVAYTESEVTSNGSIVGSGRFLSEGRSVVELVGVRLSPADGARSGEMLDTHHAARLEWGPSLDFVPKCELLPRSDVRKEQLAQLDELCLLYMLSEETHFRGRKGLSLGVHEFLAWVEAECHGAEDSVGRLSEDLRQKRILELHGELCDTSAKVAAEAFQLIQTRIECFLSANEIEDILPAAMVEDLHRLIFAPSAAQFLRHMRHHKPDLRVLELGVGGHSLVEEVAGYLTRSDGHVCIAKYTTTSPLSGSKSPPHNQRFEVEHLSLDINETLDFRELEGQRFDFILVRRLFTACRVTDTTTALRNLKHILSAEGRILVQEIPDSWRWAQYIFRTVPRFTPSQPDPSTLTRLAKNGGEIGLEATASDTTVILKPIVPVLSSKRVTFLRAHPLGTHSPLIRQFQKEGYNVTECTIGDTPPAGQDIVPVLDENGPFLESLDENQYNSLNVYLNTLGRDSGILWMTLHSQMGCSNPGSGQIIGLARTMRSELRLDMATCEVDDFSSHPDLVVQIFERFQRRKSGQAEKPEFEYAVKNGRVHVGRYFPFNLKDELISSDSDDRTILDVGVPGRLNTLRWMKVPRHELASNEVEIQVHSAGLNFKDIVVAMGIIELPTRALGLEAAGVITRVGRDVERFKVGDRVACLTSQAFSTTATAADFCCVQIPDGVEFDEAATMVIPFGTVMYSLVDVARLERGQSILVHSACGGVGLAALQVAKMIGADIYATVSTEEKVSFLVDNFHIPRNRIFQSRDDSFLEGVMRETGGQGVDLVLNSLSGDLLHASWECVAEFGTMIELGKRDLLEGAKLDMKPFIANRSYRCVAFDHLIKRPKVTKRVLESVFEHLEKGGIQPIRPVRMFDATEAQEAFQYMQKGAHIGRIGMSMRGASNLTPTPKTPVPHFNSDASYLLTGGLGGIGRTLATYMAENGARELIFLSRSAGSNPSEDAFGTELRSLGCLPVFVKGDVCDLGAVRAAIRKATRPLKGIVHLSMVLQDRSFSDMTFDQWKRVCDPKVVGTWNLHHASANIALDFMVLCSSIAGQVGQPGQANYASANTFMDAFAQYRNGLGLAASVVDIGPVEDVGLLTHNDKLLSNMKATGFHMVREQDLLDALVSAMSRPAPKENPDRQESFDSYSNGFVLGLATVSPHAPWKDDRRMAAYCAGPTEEKPSVDANMNFKQLLRRVSEDPSVLRTAETAQLLSVEIGRKLADMLLRPQVDDLDTSASLTDLGMDSLVAAELRAWWRLVFGFDVSVREILGMGTLEALGKYAAKGLLKSAAESK
ncbi:putative polyketide synthase [Xylariaceae sp. FL0594]|nr:putative polyketide synthase [Xylariaceae sp. FL0594]